MRKYRLVAVAGVILAAAGAPAQTPVQFIAARLTANDLKADVSFLASDALEGRGTPSRGQEVAAEFVAAQFRRAGLEPIGDDGYFQTAAYVLVTPVLDGLEVTLEIPGGEPIKADGPSVMLSRAAGVDLSHAAVFKPAPDADLEALTPEQVRGKVLVLEARGRGMRQATLAKLQPALVVQLVIARGAGGRAPQMGARAGAAQVAEAAAVQVAAIVVFQEAFAKALSDAKPGLLEATISAHIAAPTVTPVKLRNVAGLLRGSDPALKDTYVLVTAHYDHLGVRGTGEGDHIYNGANDDASGTASVIEIANALAALPARPKRSIVFMAFFGEEMGLLGSRYYSLHPIFPLKQTVADINLEQMGRTDDNSGPRVGQVNVTGYDFSTLTAELKKAGDEAGVQVVKDEQNSDRYFGQSDNQAFADLGVPAHTLSVTYAFPGYHGPADEWQKIDYENMAKVDRAVALGVWRVADSAEPPKWNAENPKTERYRLAR